MTCYSLQAQKCCSLAELWALVNDINKRHFPNHGLMPILGNGRTFRPNIMFVFINPTHANISSSRDWQGPRFPFIGTKPVWRIFHRAGLFDDKLMNEINSLKTWSLEFTNKVLNFLKKKSFYLTNIVKWTGHDASLPNSEKIKLFLPILEREIELVQPKYIVTFGTMPFEGLTGQKINLGKYYAEVMAARELKFYEPLAKNGDSKTKIVPCYFPVGRGNPKKAVEILKMVGNL